MRFVYPATLCPESNGGYSIWFDDLPGCATEGQDLADAINAAQDALGVWLFSALKNGDEIPKASDTNQIDLEDSQTITLVAVDLVEFERRTNGKLVKKTLSIPNWLNQLGESKNINFSKLLQDSLIEQLGVSDR